jgi:methionine-rich copper-binding protein CopC
MRINTSKLSFIAAAAIFFAALLPAASASAHAELETSNPEANSVVSAAPGVVSLTFGEKLLVLTGEDAANQVQVTDGSNVRADNGDYQVTGEVLTVSLKPDLPDDTYKVTYRVVSADGHPIEGVYEFTVNSMARSLEATPMAVSDDGSPSPMLYQAGTEEKPSNDGSAIGWSVAVGAVLIAAATIYLFRRNRSTRK